MRILVLGIVGTLAACSQFVEHNTRVTFPDSDVRQISVHRLIGGDPQVEAYAEISGTRCKIFLRKYPRCLQHEVRHCYEGNWHAGRKTAAEC